jgi:hypothetical protein
VYVTMERETPVIARRQLVSETVIAEPSPQYRAPLATFLALAASGRASRRATEEAEAGRRELIPGVCLSR